MNRTFSKCGSLRYMTSNIYFIQRDRHDITEILLKVALNTINYYYKFYDKQHLRRTLYLYMILAIPSHQLMTRAVNL
jgi:hypothetical protein